MRSLKENAEIIQDTRQSYYMVLRKLNTNIIYVMKVGKEEVKIEGTVGAKQGINLGLILFVILIIAISTNKIMIE